MGRYISVLFITVLCLFCITGSVEAAQKGDINGDGRIDNTDLNIIKQYLTDARGLTPYEKSIADVNNDGQVTISDMVLILQISQGDITASGDILGDVNSDGRLDKSDVILLLSYVQGKQQLTPRGMAVADTTKDGQINIMDCVWILNVVTGKAIYPISMAHITSGWYKIVPVRDQSKAAKVSVAPSLKFTDKSQKLAGYIGKSLSLDTYTGKAYQKFYICNSNGAYTISAGNCGLNLFSKGGSNEAVLAQYNGEWVFIESGNAIYIASKNNKGMVLAYFGGNISNGTMLETSSIDNVDGQKWMLVPVDAPTDEEKDEDLLSNSSDNERPSVLPGETSRYMVAPPCQNLLLRAEPNNKCNILAKMPKGGFVKVLSIEGDWARVEFNGQQGYAFAKFLQKA